MIRHRPSNANDAQSVDMRGLLHAPGSPDRLLEWASSHAYPVGYSEPNMIKSAVFISNRNQAVWLPKPVAFPEDVHQVEIIKIGSRRLIPPVGKRWDDYFLNGPRVSSDFLDERIQPAPETRDSF